MQKSRAKTLRRQVETEVDRLTEGARERYEIVDRIGRLERAIRSARQWSGLKLLAAGKFAGICATWPFVTLGGIVGRVSPKLTEAEFAEIVDRTKRQAYNRAKARTNGRATRVA